jgi:hypothetical protein
MRFVAPSSPQRKQDNFDLSNQSNILPYFSVPDLLCNLSETGTDARFIMGLLLIFRGLIVELPGLFGCVYLVTG